MISNWLLHFLVLNIIVFFISLTSLPSFRTSSSSNQSSSFQALQSVRKKFFPESWSEFELDCESFLDDEQRSSLAFQQLKAVWVVANKPDTSSSGLDSQGLGTLRLQVQGGRLVAMAHVSELMHYFRKDSLPEVLAEFQKITDDEVPDSWEVPSFSCDYVKTGDVTYTPPGFLMAEKCITDASVSVKLHLSFFNDTLAEGYQTIMSQVTGKPITTLVASLVDDAYPKAEEGMTREIGLNEKSDVALKEAHRPTGGGKGGDCDCNWLT